MRTKLDVIKAFSPAPGLSQTQNMKRMKVEAAFKELATEVIDLVPESPDRTAALRKILNAKFECIQAITHPIQQGGQNAQHQQDQQQQEKKDEPS